MSLNDPDFKPAPAGLVRRTIRRRWWAILACGLIVAVPAGLYAMRQYPPTYRAFSLLRVEPQMTDLYGIRAKGETHEAFMQTQMLLLTSPNVLSAAGTNPKAAVLARVQQAGDVVQELRKVIAVSVIPQTYLIEVAMTSPNGFEAATLVDAVVEAFMEANYEWSDGMTRAQIRNLEAYHVELKTQIDELERQWKTLAAKGDVDLKAKEANLISPEQGTMIERKLVENDLSRIEAQAQLDAYRSLKLGDAGKIEELKLRIEAANLVEKALRDKRDSGGFEPRSRATDAVQIALIQDERNALKGMEIAVIRRLEQLRYEAKGEARIRPVNPNGAAVPGRPFQDFRLMAVTLTSLASFALVFSGFLGVGAMSGSPVAGAKSGPPSEG